MSLQAQYPQQGLQPYFEYGPAPVKAVNLPYGGPTGTGGQYAQGLAVGVVSTTQATEVATLTIGGSPTGGTFTVTFTGDQPYTTSALAYNVTPAAFQTALVAAVPEWNGNVAVTGTAGSSYVVTFAGTLLYQRIGGSFAVNVGGLTGGAPTGSWARTTRGSSQCQYDVYSQANNNDLDGFVINGTSLTPGGARVTALGSALGQPFQIPAFIGGYFNPNVLVGVDANAYTLGKLIKKCGGQVVRLL